MISGRIRPTVLLSLGVFTKRGEAIPRLGGAYCTNFQARDIYSKVVSGPLPGPCEGIQSANLTYPHYEVTQKG